MFKKFLSVILTCAMLLSMVSTAFAVEAEPMGITEGENTVTIRIIGSSIPDTKPNVGNTSCDYGGAQYQNWLKTTTYHVADGTTTQQLIVQALTVAGFTYTMPSEYLNKLEIYAPAEFGGHVLKNSVKSADGQSTSGKWIITINNNGAYKSENASKMSDAVVNGDQVILRYVWNQNTEKNSGKWESNTWAVKDLSPADYSGSQNVMALIHAIGRVTPESGAAITAARQAYEALSADARTLVTNYDLLTAAEQTYQEIVDNASNRTALPAPTISAGTAGFYTYVPNASIEGVDPEKYIMVYRVSLDEVNWGPWQTTIEKLLPMASYYVQGKALSNDWTLYNDSEYVSNTIQITTAGEAEKVVCQVTDADTLAAALQAVQADGKLYVIDFVTDVVIDDLPSKEFTYNLPADSHVLMTSANGSKYYFNEPSTKSHIGVAANTVVTVRDLYIGTLAPLPGVTSHDQTVFCFTENGGVINFDNVTAFTTHGKSTDGTLVCGKPEMNKRCTGTVNVYSGVMNAVTEDQNLMYLVDGSTLNLIPTGNIMLEGPVGEVKSVNILDLFGVKTLTAEETTDLKTFSQVDVNTMTTVMKYSKGLRLNVTEGITVPPAELGEITIVPADDPNAATADVTYVVSADSIAFTRKDRPNAVYQIKIKNVTSGKFYNYGDNGALDHTQTFTGLKQDTDYQVTVRFSSLDASFTDVEKTVTIRTSYIPVVLDAPTLSEQCEKTDTTITVTAPATSAQDGTATAQYRIRKAGTEAWSQWQDSSTFTDLAGYTDYELQTRYKAGHYLWLDSAESNTITVKTRAPALPAPPVADAEDITVEFDTVTVPVPEASSADPDAVIMYRIGTLKNTVGLMQNNVITEDQIAWGEWQESNVFAGLEADTTYYVQSQYVTEKAEWNNSVLSEIVEIKTATSESAPHFKVESASGKAGSEVKVFISIRNNPGIMNASLKIHYDNTKLQLVGYEDRNLLPEGVFSQYLDANPFIATWNSIEELNVNGNLLVLTFKILEGCQIGDVTDITVTYDPEDVYDVNLQNVKFAVVNGTVTVTSHAWGEATYTWNDDHTECTATHSCICCDTPVSESETVHTSIETVPPTETEKGSTTYTAVFTKTGFTTQTYEKVLPATGTIIEIGTAEGCVGEEVKVTVSFAQNPGIAGAELILNYDAEKLEFVGFENGEILSNIVTNAQHGANALYVSWENGANTEGDGVVLTLIFRIKDAAAVGDTAAVTIASFKSHDYDTNDVEFNPIDGEITVVEHTWSEWSYTWNAEHTVCTVQRQQTCGCGAVQKQSVRTTVVSQDCTTKVYLAHFTIGAADVTQTVAINDHKHVISGSDDGSTITYTCTLCGDSYDVVVSETPEASALPVLTISNVQGYVGKTVSVPVILSNNPGLKSVEFTVAYNAAALKLVDVVDGGLFGSFSWRETAARTGSAVICLGGADEIADTTTNGKVVTLVFEIVSASEEASVSISYQDGEVYSGDSGNVDVIIDNGTVAIKTFVLGDVNKDGAVDIKDVTILRRYLAGTVAPDTVDVPAADCNEDGEADIKDVTILRRYLAGTAELGR